MTCSCLTRGDVRVCDYCRPAQVDRTRKLFKVLCYDFHDKSLCSDKFMMNAYSRMNSRRRDCELGEWGFPSDQDFPFRTDEYKLNDDNTTLVSFNPGGEGCHIWSGHDLTKYVTL